MNRRSFLMCAGGAVWAQTPPSGQIVLGVIGAGARGMQLLNLLLADSSVRIGAICETYEPRMFEAAALARSKGHPARYYRLYRDLLSDKSIDAVVIATPDFWHARMTVEAIEQGKDVYVEQPLSRTWQEGLAIIAAHRRSRQIVQVGHQRRSSPYFAAREQKTTGRIEARASAGYLRSGILKRGPTKLSEPLNFEDWQAAAEPHVPYSPDRFFNWRFYSSYSGGCIAQLATPLLDGVHAVCGLGYPISVAAHGTNSREIDFDTVQRAQIEIEYSGGNVVSMEVDGASRSREDIASLPAELDGTAAKDATDLHLADFLASIRGRVAPRATPEAVFPATLACQMANLSIASARPVRWNAAAMRVEA
jgi:predicted dehydrogenase